MWRWVEILNPCIPSICVRELEESYPRVGEAVPLSARSPAPVETCSAYRAGSAWGFHPLKIAWPARIQCTSTATKPACSNQCSCSNTPEG